MTENKKLCCPFCGAELDMYDSLYWSCTNRQCEIWSDMIPISVWQALIDGKRAQDALNRAISEITDLCTTILYCSGEFDNEIQMIQERDEMVAEAKVRIFDTEIAKITKRTDS